MAFRFEHLDIWKDSNIYTLKIYKLTKTFPREEQFALVDQLRRSASSISANIAEGSGSSSNKDFCHYLDIATKSVYETVSHLHLAYQLGYISDTIRQDLYSEAESIVKKIKSFKKWLK